MKIAVLADIHGNLQALHEVCEHVDRWRPDAVLVAGDVVNRGPRSRECLSLVRTRCTEEQWRLVRGNHEEYVIERGAVGAPSSPAPHDVYAAVDWTYRAVRTRVAELSALPVDHVLPTEAGDVVVTHGSILGSRDGIYPDTPRAELRKKTRPGAAVFAVGHTHRPLLRSIDRCQIVNAGSVGLPFDGDLRAAYARAEFVSGGWRTQIVRLDYDRTAAQAEFERSGFLDGSGPLGRLILHEFTIARPCLAAWTRAYFDAVVAKELTMEAAVIAFLDSP